MIRGIIEFKCDQCGRKFYGPDIEFGATVFTTPLPCPNCGSRHTMPSGLYNLVYKSIYRSIWKGIDEGLEKKQDNGKGCESSGAFGK